MRINRIIFFFLLTGCSNTDVDKATVEMHTQVDTLKAKLIGRWGGLGEDSAVWEIRIDSIYYFQERRTYSYKLLDNDLVIERDESKGILRNISVIEDTMKFDIHEGVSINGYRHKTKK